MRAGRVAGIAALTLTEIKRELEAGNLSSVEVIRAFKGAYQEDLQHDLPLNGFIEFFEDAEIMAIEADKMRASGVSRSLLGLPLAVKDNILIQGRAATCASASLKGFRAPYSATVVKRLSGQGAIPMGRCNMDEFAMGSSCEYSVYGPTRNPVDRQRTPGGSSGGPAAVVAARQAPCALGSDTGGSVRLPASFCGIYGFKPSYGCLSRFGLVAFGSSLDQIGILARCPEDIALILSVAAGADSYDSTSEAVDFSKAFPLKEEKIGELKVAVPQEFTGEGMDPEVLRVLDNFSDWLKNRGAAVERVSLPILQASIAIYYIIALAEASSNLARYDGVRYGLRDNEVINLEELYFKSRSRGFGPEVKRRIFIGNFVLSSGYYDAYYKKAMEVRALLRLKIAELLKDYDLILSATSPTPAFRIGEKVEDPFSMYLTDLCTLYANLAHLPSLSIPAGITGNGLPVGVQISGRRFAGQLLLGVAQAWDKEKGGS